MEFKFEELWKFITESCYFILGAGLEGKKDKKWKGALFIWPFAIAFLVIIYLVVREFV